MEKVFGLTPTPDIIGRGSAMGAFMGTGEIPLSPTKTIDLEAAEWNRKRQLLERWAFRQRAAEMMRKALLQAMGEVGAADMLGEGTSKPRRGGKFETEFDIRKLKPKQQRPPGRDPLPAARIIEARVVKIKAKAKQKQLPQKAVVSQKEQVRVVVKKLNSIPLPVARKAAVNIQTEQSWTTAWEQQRAIRVPRVEAVRVQPLKQHAPVARPVIPIPEFQARETVSPMPVVASSVVESPVNEPVAVKPQEPITHIEPLLPITPKAPIETPVIPPVIRPAIHLEQNVMPVANPVPQEMPKPRLNTAESFAHGMQQVMGSSIFRMNPGISREAYQALPRAELAPAPAISTPVVTEHLPNVMAPAAGTLLSRASMPSLSIRPVGHPLGMAMPAGMLSGRSVIAAMPAPAGIPAAGYSSLPLAA